MARLALIFLVAVINLGLGFAVAIQAGRGPWSRRARQLALKRAAGKEAPTLPAVAEGPARAPAPPAAKPIEQIAEELDALEVSLHQLQQRIAAGADPTQALQDLRSLIRQGLEQIQELELERVAESHPEQAVAGLYALQVVFETVATELGESGEIRPGGTGLEDAAARVLMACREATVVFNGLRFAELPA